MRVMGVVIVVVACMAALGAAGVVGYFMWPWSRRCDPSDHQVQMRVKTEAWLRQAPTCLCDTCMEIREETEERLRRDVVLYEEGKSPWVGWKHTCAACRLAAEETDRRPHPHLRYAGDVEDHTYDLTGAAAPEDDTVW